MERSTDRYGLQRRSTSSTCSFACSMIGSLKRAEILSRRSSNDLHAWCSSRQNWKPAQPFYGPYRILSLTPTNAEIHLVDKPNDPAVFVSWKICPCYSELGDKSWSGKATRGCKQWSASKLRLMLIVPLKLHLLTMQSFLMWTDVSQDLWLIENETVYCEHYLFVLLFIIVFYNYYSIDLLFFCVFCRGRHSCKRRGNCNPCYQLCILMWFLWFSLFHQFDHFFPVIDVQLWSQLILLSVFVQSLCVHCMFAAKNIYLLKLPNSEHEITYRRASTHVDRVRKTPFYGPLWWLTAQDARACSSF